MKRNKMSTQQLKDIYYKTTHGDTISDAARFLGLTEGNAYQAKQSLTKYMGWIMDGSVKTRKQLRKNYLIAAKWAIEQDSLSIKRPVVEEVVATPPHARHRGTKTNYSLRQTRFAIWHF